MDGEAVTEEEAEQLRKEKKMYTGIFWARKTMRH
jgi:hypothetical protein